MVVGRFFVVGLVVIVLFGLGIPATDLIDCNVEWVGGRRCTNGTALLLRNLSSRSSTVGPTRKSLRLFRLFRPFLLDGYPRSTAKHTQKIPSLELDSVYLCDCSTTIGVPCGHRGVQLIDCIEVVGHEVRINASGDDELLCVTQCSSEDIVQVKNLGVVLGSVIGFFCHQYALVFSENGARHVGYVVFVQNDVFPS
jgi:hypothetical protein